MIKIMKVIETMTSTIVLENCRMILTINRVKKKIKKIRKKNTKKKGMRKVLVKMTRKKNEQMRKTKEMVNNRKYKKIWMMIRK